MTCADHLLRDHDDLAAMLHVMTASAARLQQGQYVDPAMLQGLDRFLQQFVADGYFRKQRTVFLPHVRAVLPDQTALTHEIARLRARCLAPMEDFHRVVERALAGGLESQVDDLTSLSCRCVERLSAHLETERPLLDRARLLPHAGDQGCLDRCAQLDRHCLGAAGREWYAQLVSDYVDIVRTWSAWPATSGAPAIDSGRSSPRAERTEAGGHLPPSERR